MTARSEERGASEQSVPFWAMLEGDLLRSLGTTKEGLSVEEAAERLRRFRPNAAASKGRSRVLILLLRQFTSPVVLILIGAAILSVLLRDLADSAIILAIVLISGLLGFKQEYGAAAAVKKLLDTVELKASVLRGGQRRDVPMNEVVPGDIVYLSAGDGIPGDCRLLGDRDLSVDEAALTGENYPAEKEPGDLPADTPLARRTNALFFGTHVVSGSGLAAVVTTGRGTVFGALADRIGTTPPETEFERGVRRFGIFLSEITFILVVLIFAINAYLHKPVLESFLFALALSVGLTPQLLPAVISVNLARGAQEMAKRRVIVKKLSAIENFGAMNVLCSDKTGTITEGKIELHSAVDRDGRASDRVLRHAQLNALFQTGFRNPIDQALVACRPFDARAEGWARVDEVPYDFVRKRLSILASHEGRSWLITKGALSNVLEVCSSAEGEGSAPVPMDQAREGIERLYRELSAKGFRTLGVALRELPAGTAAVKRQDEVAMTFLGLLVLYDPPKEGIERTIAALKELGVALKIVTGDNALVAAEVARSMGFENPVVLTGGEVKLLSEEALPVRAGTADVFAEIEPNQKERIILALRRAGNVVGYMGDGINDALALHGADVGISVQDAVDVAKDSADIVLLDRDLGVLEAGIREGRRTFANTIKYVLMAASANFGNMFSMAGASLFLPFLPLLPKQILLTNLFTDLPELTIATDEVDPEWIVRPRRWSVTFIRRFMLTFGLVSSLFDYLTFAVLLFGLSAGPQEFRTGWYLESVVSASLVVLSVRTRRGIVGSTPSRPLLFATGAVVLLALLLPYTPLGGVFGFIAAPMRFVAPMAAIVAAYIISVEAVKRWVYARYGAETLS